MMRITAFAIDLYRILRGMLVSLLLITGVSAETLSDPTRPLNVEEDVFIAGTQQQLVDGFPMIRVSAIFVSPTEKYAIINGNTYFEGQTLLNVVVKAIYLNGVTLAKADVSKTFDIQPITIKKDVSDVL